MVFEITKKIKIIILIAIPIAILAYLQFFTKFKIIDTKNTLSDSSIIINSIDEIAELTTVRYYGEVIASSKMENTDSHKKWVGELFDTIRITLNDIYNNPVEYNLKRNNRTSRMNLFKREFQNLYKDERYDILRKIIPFKRERKFLNYIRREKRYNFEKSYKKYSKSRKNRDKIVYIGRGWVTAGFDLKNFNFDNDIDYKENRIIIKNILPIILDTIINPWFSPKKRIKGFEILHSEGRKIDFDLIKATKKKCKVKLYEQALRRDILEATLESAEENLTDFFSLILNKKIDSVIFDIPKYYTLGKTITYDKILDENEVFKIANRIKDLDNADDEQMNFISSLDNLIKSENLIKNKDESLVQWNGLKTKLGLRQTKNEKN